MRNSLIESLLIGCGVGLGVVLVQALTQSAAASTQLLALLIAGIVLFCIQLALTLRRTRQGEPPAELQKPDAPGRGRRNAFVRELTHDWTGLDAHRSERDASGPRLPDDLDDELWGEPPEMAVRKAIVKKADDQPQK